MATVEDTKTYYDHFDWRRTDEYWASRWGGSAMQWHGTILPRIHAFLPARTILEIGPGQGRLSHYLEPFASQRLILADLAEACTSGCRERFRDRPKVECVLSDGRSLGPIEDASVDFIFSFFSLVHADAATMRSYIAEIARALSPAGAAFIHHSNAGDCLTGRADADAALQDYRDTTVSAGLVADDIAEAGLVCRSQELFGWEVESALTDCFSLLARAPARFRRRKTLIYNWEFPAEAVRFGRLADAYGARRTP